MKRYLLIFLLISVTISSHAQQPIKARSNSGYVNITKDPPKPPYLEIIKGSLTFTDSDGNHTINANEQTHIHFQLQNTGMGPGLNLTARIKENNSAEGLSFNSIKNVGSIQPGTSVSVDIPITSDMNTTDGKAVFSIAITESNGFGTDPVIIEIPTRGFLSPSIKIVDYRISSQTGTTIEKRKPFDVQLLVQNIGKGTAENVTVTLPDITNIYCLSNNASITIDRLLPGEKKLVEYELIANNDYTASDIRLNLQLSEKYKRYAENREILVAMNQQVSSKKLVVTGITQEQKTIEIGSLTSVVDKNIPVNGVKNPYRIALIIGNENYSGNLNAEVNVPFARNDAQVFRQYALNTLGVQEMNLFILTDATAGEMRREIDRATSLLDRLGPQAELIFYYAGHGYPDEVSKIPYLVPVDVDATNLAAAIKLSEVYEKFGNTGARRVTVFLDACFSGGGRNQGLLAARGVRVAPKTEFITGNMVVFSASSGEQSSLPFTREQHGMFTYFLLQKLQETGGNITYSELSDYIRSKVSVESIRINGKNQDPEVNCSPQVQFEWKSWKVAD